MEAGKKGERKEIRNKKWATALKAAASVDIDLYIDNIHIYR